MINLLLEMMLLTNIAFWDCLGVLTTAVKIIVKGKLGRKTVVEVIDLFFLQLEIAYLELFNVWSVLGSWASAATVPKPLIHSNYFLYNFF